MAKLLLGTNHNDFFANGIFLCMETCGLKFDMQIKICSIVLWGHKIHQTVVMTLI